MVLTSIEIIALIFIIFGVIKLIFVIFDAMSWYKFARWIYKNPVSSSVVMFVLGALSMYHLLQEITIVQLVAAMAFTALLMGFMMLQYSRMILPMAKKMLAKKITRGIWVDIVIWLVLILWAAYKIFI